MKVEKPLKCVALYLSGHDLDPTLISKALGIKPTKAQKRGGFKAGSRRFIAKVGVWSIKIKSESRPLSDLVNELLKRIGKQSKRLNRIQGVEEAQLDILFSFGDEKKHSIDFELTNDQITKASQMGLSIYVTVL